MGHKFISQRKQTKDEMFDALVKNAIDFLDSSLDDLDKRPKNSIVDFYSSIELFLKARLMSEHWTLIISRPELASIDSFQVGDFHSVFLEDAIKRMKNVLREPLPQKAIDNFKALGEHRNQIVHFAHTGYLDIEAAKARVVVEQWSAWHYLHELIIVNWKPVFNDYLAEIERIHRRMMGQKSFISARYTEIKPQIEIRKKAGNKIETCAHCSTDSAVLGEIHPWGVDYECMVCSVNDTFIKLTDEIIPCENCGEEFAFFDKNLKNCPHCNDDLDTGKLIKACANKYTEGDDWWEEGQEYIAFCHACTHEEASVFYIDGFWSCVSCFDRGWGAISCPRCDEYVTGDMETIKYFACVKCQDQVRAEFAENGF